MGEARYLLAVVGVVIALLSASAVADEYLLMARSKQGFPETMLVLQSSIKEHGYTLSRVQRVDIGLTASGFQTDKYRIVFFGKLDEVRDLKQRYPQLIPYLPLHMTIFAEGEDTLVVAEDLTLLPELASTPELSMLFQRWKNDVLSIMDELRRSEH